jgi:hypothetical protein
MRVAVSPMSEPRSPERERLDTEEDLTPWDEYRPGPPLEMQPEPHPGSHHVTSVTRREGAGHDPDAGQGQDRSQHWTPAAAAMQADDSGDRFEPQVGCTVGRVGQEGSLTGRAMLAAGPGRLSVDSCAT